MSAVEVCMPRVSDVPAEVSAQGFRSEIVGRYERRSRTQARLLVRLYLEGLASGDFEPIFRALVGETAALSPQSIGRLKAEWKQEFEITVPNATNAALAIGDRHWVGILYQQLVSPAVGVPRWETHVQVTRNGWATPPDDIVLATTPDTPNPPGFGGPHERGVRANGSQLSGQLDDEDE